MCQLEYASEMISAPKLRKTYPLPMWPGSPARYAPSPPAPPITAHLQYDAMVEKTTLQRRPSHDHTQTTPRRSFHLRACRVRASRMLLWDTWVCGYSFSSNLQHHMVGILSTLFSSSLQQHLKGSVKMRDLELCELRQD